MDWTQYHSIIGYFLERYSPVFRTMSIQKVKISAGWENSFPNNIKGWRQGSSSKLGE